MQMMRHVLASAVFAFSMASTVPSRAADVSVNGQIRSDGACSIALGNGGIIDLGNLSRKDFLTNRWRIIRDMPLTFNCQRPTKVGVELIDNRVGTLPPGRLPWQGYFGLGNPAIGSYHLSSYSADRKADGKLVSTISRSKGKIEWYVSAEDGGVSLAGWNSYTTTSWGTTKWSAEPVAFTTLKDTLKVRLDFKDDIAFTDELEIDGSLTLELAYL